MAVYDLDGNKIDEGSALSFAVTPEDYGAKGNGTNDDTSAFQQALNQKGLILCKTGKTYRITDTLYIGSDTTLDLNDSTISAEMKHLLYNFTKTEDANTLGYNGKGNLVIKNGTIIGGSISFAHGENILLDNVHFKNSLNDHFLEIAGCKNYRILNCSFIGMGDWKTSVYEYINLDRCIYGNIPWMTQGDAFYDETVNADILVDGCEFDLGESTFAYGYNAFGAHSGGSGLHNGITISNCDIKSFTGCGLRLNGMQNVFVNNNRIQVSGNGIVIGDVQTCNTLVIKNNYVTSTNGANLVKTANRYTNLTVVGNSTAGTEEEF